MNLKELAQTLGLSQTTVSRALNGYPEVNEATRARVTEAASRLNYHPNTRARSLATGRAMAIAHVIPLSTKHEMLNPIFADFIAGAGETYSKAGYDMTLSIVSDEDETRVYRELASNRNVDGIIVHAPSQDDPRIRLLQELDMPFVVHGRSTGHETDYSWVDVNNRRSFERATRHLIDLGHTRIALINGLESMDFALRRREGFTSALSDAGISVDPVLMLSDEMTEIYGFKSTRDLLAGPNPPTAFMVSSMISALGVRRGIEDAGLQMGRDISLITHDDDLSYFRNDDDVPVYTAVRSSVREAGRQSAALLLDLVTEQDADPRHVLLEAELLLGQSTGPAPDNIANQTRRSAAAR